MQSRNLAYLPRLDHLRLVAVLLVFAFHLYHLDYRGFTPNPSAAWIAPIVEGHTGVALFFVLSGFIFMLIGLQGPIDYRGFLHNRLLRIAPLYLTVFVLAASLGRDKFAATDLLYVLVPNIGTPPTSDFFITGTAWTIGVEFAFYLVFPFLCRFFLQSGWRYLLGLALVLALFKLAAYFIVKNPTHFYYSTLVGRFDQFLVGMAAARLYAEQGHRLARFAWPLMLGAVGATYAALWSLARYASFMSPDGHQPLWIVWSAIEALCWAAVIVAYLLLPVFRGRLADKADRLARWGGSISFSFYLLHASVLFVLLHTLGVLQLTPWFAVNYLVNFALAFAACWGMATVSFLCIEKPFLQLRRQYVKPAP
ncbi:MAG: acyltransferase [Pseudomonadota bacterium]